MKEVGIKLKVGASGLENVDALTKQLQGMGVETTALEAKAAELDAELKKLQGQQGLIDNFARTKVAVAAAETAMGTAKTRASELAQELNATKAAAASQQQALATAGAAAKDFGAALDAQKARTKALAQEIKDLGANQGLIDSFKRQKQAVADAGDAMATAKIRAGELGREIAATEAPTRAQQAAFEKARTAARSAEAAYDTQRVTLQGLRSQLSSSGVATDDLAGAQVRVRQQLAQATDGLQASRAEVKRLGDEQKAAGANVAALGRELAGTEKAVSQQERAFQQARTAARAADDAYTSQRLTLQGLRGQLTASGIASDDLAGAQARIGRATAGAKDQVRATADWAQRLATAERSASAEANALAASAGKSATAVRSQGDAAKDSTAKLDGMGASLKQLATVGVAGILGGQTAQLLKDVAATADEYANLRARIRLVVGEGDALASAMQSVGEIALRTNSNLQSTGTLFARIAQAGKELGQSQQQALQLTETINQAVQLSGASATASDAAITQLIQGLQSGVLRGEEFNSVMEQAPRLALALAAGIGVTTGELRGLAEQGKLTSQVVITALQSQRAALEKEFASLPATVGRAVENLRTKWALFVGTLNDGSGATASVANGINGLADNLDKLAGVATRAGAVLLAALAVQGAAALRTLAVEMLTTGAAARLLTADLNKIPKTINIAIAVVGFEVGFKIGQMLHENSALARKLGVNITQYFATLLSALQLLKEAAAAIFSSDTIEAAFKRDSERMQEIRGMAASMREEAKKSPEVIRAAAAVAAAQTKALGDAATQAGADTSAAAAGGAASLGAMGAAAQSAGASVAGAGAAGAAGLQSTAQAAAKASDAVAALAAAAATAGRTLPALGASADQQALSLARLISKGGEAAVVFARDLPAAIAKLGGAELEQFRVAIVQALTQAQEQALRLAAGLKLAGESGSKELARAEQAGRLMQVALAEVGKQAAQSLGVDVVAAGTRVSQAFETSNQNLSVLLRSLPQLAQAGINTGTVVAQALGGMINGAKNQAEVDLVISRIKALERAGVVTGNQVAGALELARLKARALAEELAAATPGVQNLAEAARNAGVDVDRLTTGLSEGVRTGAKAVRDLAVEVQKAGIDAQRASPLLAEALDKQVQAAATKEEVKLLVEVTRELGATGKLSGDEYAAALDKLKSKADQLDPVLKQIKKSADDATRSATAAVVAANAAAQALSSAPVINAQTGNNREQRLAGQNAVSTAAQDELLARAKVGNVTAQDLPFAQQVLAALKQNQQVNAFAASKGSNLSFAGEQSFTALLVQATHAVELASAAAAAADAGARTVGLANRTVNVNLNVGGKSYQVNGTQNNVDGLLAALEQARLASGGG